MLYANINQIDKHDYLAERFKKGYEFLRSADLMSLPVGRVDIDGDDVAAIACPTCRFYILSY